MEDDFSRGCGQPDRRLGVQSWPAQNLGSRFRVKYRTLPHPYITGADKRLYEYLPRLFFPINLTFRTADRPENLAALLEMDIAFSDLIVADKLGCWQVTAIGLYLCPTVVWLTIPGVSFTTNALTATDVRTDTAADTNKRGPNETVRPATSCTEYCKIFPSNIRF